MRVERLLWDVVADEQGLLSLFVVLEQLLLGNEDRGRVDGALELNEVFSLGLGGAPSRAGVLVLG